MKWTAKFDFFDLYKRRLGKGQFNPGGSLRIETIGVPNENTIILGGSKIQRDFNNDPFAPSVAVLFASKDKGQHYQEILIGEEDLEYLLPKDNYTLVRAFTMNDGVKFHKVFLIDNSSFELIKVAEYKNGDDVRYADFDGQYIVKEAGGSTKLINVFNQEEEFEIPTTILKADLMLYHTENGKLLFMEDRKIIEYDAKTGSSIVVKELNNQYDFFWYNDGMTFGKKEKQNNVQKEKSINVSVYNAEEVKVFDLTRENSRFYRYKNFVCDYRRLGVKPQIRYSYDYGKTWKTHYVNGFTIQTNRVGFYKDQFMVVEGIFWHGDSPESGGRIMVGEFVK